MNTRLARTMGRLTATTAAAVAATAAVLIPAGVAHADPVDDGAPSACNPVHVNAVVEPAPASSGHRHYSVVLSAAPGTADCTVQGSPSDLVFSLNGAPRAIDVQPYGDQTRPVVFGPAHPVRFDVQVPTSAGPAQANETAFALHSPLGESSGDYVAHGPIEVDAGTRVGPFTER
ncbi:hypothetical protein [Pseudonocardia sp. HH130630-07]|uniref:hypothetical protein n=1 Tax=Pseudonocardia sp. HH130630-07 TaxID=1690815 RepID=UPI0008152DCE|nr:hypothetical protein [Pseudonocardia sp. HH130630-07]ANY06028.1 hypothetical protein AFB00_06590 [Pseudonocardia sp. HH130630-07]